MAIIADLNTLRSRLRAVTSKMFSRTAVVASLLNFFTSFTLYNLYYIYSYTVGAIDGLVANFLTNVALHLPDHITIKKFYGKLKFVL